MIDINILKNLQKEDRVTIVNRRKENHQREDYRVMATTEYAIHVMGSLREFLVYRWNEYGTAWEAIEYTKNSPTTDTVAPSPTVGKNNVVKLPTVAKEPQEKEPEEKPQEISVKSEDAISERDKPTIEPSVNEDVTVGDMTAIETAAVKESKTSMAQKKAIKKYTDKFERINCRLEAGTLDKISALGYKSNNQFIVEAVSEKLTGIKMTSKPKEITSLKEVRDRKTTISKEVFESIKDAIVSEELFMDKELSSEEVLSIIEKKFMEE